MNIVLGFGSTEELYREKVERDIEVIVSECLNNRFGSTDDVVFTEEICKDIRERIEEYAEKTRFEKKKISEKEIKDRPERYSYVYINFAHTLRDLFFGINFSHINSRHPMSPDGMAMMQVRDCKWIQARDFRDKVPSIELNPELLNDK